MARKENIQSMRGWGCGGKKVLVIGFHIGGRFYQGFIEGLLLVLILGGGVAGGETKLHLPEISALGNFAPMTLVRSQASGDCSTLADRFRQLADLNQQNSQGISDYLGDLSSLMQVWYQDLAPLEGNNVFINKGSFSPIARTSENVGASAQIVAKNSSELQAILESLVNELTQCLK